MPETLALLGGKPVRTRPFTSWPIFGKPEENRLLRTLRLVRSRRDGRMVHYRLDDDHITGLLAQGLDHVNEAGTRRER